jgi:hypothetical protein
MTKESYKETLKIALGELAELMNQRDQLDEQLDDIDRRIFQLREGLFGLAILCGTDTNRLAESYPQLFPDLIPPDTGLTDAIRKALQSKRIFYSPVEVRDRLEEDFNYDLSKYKNVLPSIHTVLKRLVESQEIEPGNRDGKVVYRWKAFAPPGNPRSPKPYGMGGLLPPDALTTLNEVGEGYFTKLAKEDKKK